MRSIRHITASIVAAFATLSAVGASFAEDVDGRTLYFDISDDNAVTLTFSHFEEGHAVSGQLTGDVVVPSTITHDGQSYTITSIGRKAFANNEGLTGIVIPSTVTSIGDFAFENCRNLKSVVFPGNEITLGEGAFFDCTGLEDLTFGSDWTSIDLNDFRWSNKIRNLRLPARVERLTGVKRMKGLESFEVDINNRTFVSRGGLLYSRDGETLYACPRGFRGRADVADGTKRIMEGAFRDCNLVSDLILPSSLESIDMRETGTMSGLKTVTLLMEPAANAYNSAEEEVFVLMLPEGAKLKAPKSNLNGWKALLPTAGGNFRASLEPGSALFFIGNPVKKIEKM